MKKEIYFSMLFLALLGMANSGVRAQDVEVVNYPYGNYLNWQCDSYTPPSLMDGIVLATEPVETSHDGQFIGYRLHAIPFNFSPTGESTTCTIYGVAVPFEMIQESIPLDQVIDYIIGHDFDVTFYIYKATEGDTNLQLIKEYTDHIHQGQYPDKLLRMSSPSIYSDNCFAMWEIYFDLPVTIDGTFLVAISTPDHHSVHIPIIRSSCWRGYIAEILTYKGNTKLCQWDADGCVSRGTGRLSLTQALAIPEITDSIRSHRFQGLCPILVPYGTTAAGEVRAEASAVRLTPNPAHGQVEVQSPHGIRAVELTDMAGRTLLRQRCDDQPQSLTLDISTLPQGVYAVKVETPQTTATEKLAVQ